MIIITCRYNGIGRYNAIVGPGKGSVGVTAHHQSHYNDKGKEKKWDYLQSSLKKL